MATAILGIDPGAQGGIAICIDGDTTAIPMPDTLGAQYDKLLEIAAHCRKRVAYYEKNSGAMPGNASGATAKFARHMGHIDALLLALGYEIHMVTPAKWMDVFAPGRPRGNDDKPARKRYIKAEAERRFPGVSVTNKTADALGLLAYGMGQ